MSEQIQLHYYKRTDGGIYATGMPIPQDESDVLATEAEVNAHLFAETSRVYEEKVESMLAAAAKAAGYDSIDRACIYAGAPNAYQAQSQSFLVWRSEVWQHCYAALAAVQSGQREMMTIEELLDELPQRVLPEAEGGQS